MSFYRPRPVAGIAAILCIVAACGSDDDGRTPGTSGDAAEPGRTATALASGSAELSPDELESGRLDPTWRQYADQQRMESRAGAPASDPSGARSASAAGDTSVAGDPPTSGDASATADTSADTETAGTSASDTTRAGAAEQSWEDITAEAVNAPVEGLPIHGDVAGPAVARIQILLDLNDFSPGAIDGRWGKNTEKAVYWFQDANGLEANGEVDRATLEALERAVTGEVVTTRSVEEADVSGPYQEVPEDIYDQAEQSCLCYESRREQLAEVFHTTPELLEQLNPETDLNSVSAGASLQVPAVDPFHIEDLPEEGSGGTGEIASILISDGGHYLHALDESGNILYHFPSTLGADYSPSPEGEFSVESIAFEPTWHYQPELLTGVDPSREDAVIPPGPNNAVGVVWMQLSQPHYGIHGTSAPETIGYATSNGCVRLTNWDAAFLARQIGPDTPVEFTAVTGRD